VPTGAPLAEESVTVAAPALTEESLPPAEPCLGERLVGQYRRESEENGMTWLAFYWLDGGLIAEVEQEYAAYFAAELIPDGDAEGKFRAQVFSGFSGEGEYWAETPEITLSLTPSGVMITESTGERVEFLREESPGLLHDPSVYAAAVLPPEAEAFPEALTGCWLCRSADRGRMLLQLEADGNLLWYRKTPGEPVEVLVGFGGADRQTGTISMMTEQIGWGRMPRMEEMHYALSEDGSLLLESSDANGFLPMGETIWIQQTEKEL